MKTVILAGGKGTRLSEATQTIPKPMVEIGGKPILWHILKRYALYGFVDFTIAVGYRAEVIKSYFSNFYLYNHDLHIDLSTGRVQAHPGKKLDWKVDVIDTGEETETGGRIRRLKDHLGSKTFFMTYGDGIADIDLSDLLHFHQSHGKLVTVTAVRPPARFGALVLEGSHVKQFSEKNQAQEGWINGGFFVVEPEVFNYISEDQTVWEKEPLETLAKEGELMAYLHDGFWQPMDTLREQRLLNAIWEKGEAPWIMGKKVLNYGTEGAF